MSQREPKDERLLIDFVLGRCDEAEREAAAARLAGDADFAALHQDIRRTLAALDAYAPPEPPADLVASTVARVRSQRRTEALLAEQGSLPRPRAATFGFRELLAMAAAAVLVVGIAIPSVTRARHLADRAACTANAGQIGTALHHYAHAEGNELFLPASPAATDNWLPRPGRFAASNTVGLFQLVVKRYVGPGVFQCPAAGGQSFVVTSGMTDFPSARNIAYSYVYSLGSPVHLEVNQLAERMVLLSDANPVFAGRVFRPERIRQSVSENHDGDGQNVLRMTGSVEWTTHPRVGVDGDNIWLVRGVVNYTGNERPAGPTDTFLPPSGP